MVNLIRVAMRDWLMRGIAPPPGRYPTLTGGNLVEPTQAAMGFPSGVPTVDYDIFRPENFIFPVFDYDWGPDFDRSDASGVPTNLPPPILQAIPMKVPRADADGNEVGGVPTVLNMAPLGTYLGWNITAAGFHRGQVCNYVGGYIPFALTQADRLANGDPRLSLTERYGNHDGYVAAVTAAANSAFAQGYLLAADRDALIAEAQASTVLLPASAPGSTRDTRDTRSLAAAPQLPRSPMHPRSTGIAVHQPLSAVIAPAALASAQARADVVLGFTGILAPGAFTVGNSGKLIGSTIPGAAVFTPSQLTLTGSDAVGGCQGGTYGLPGPCELRALVSASGQFTFNWAYSTVDSDGPPGDIFGVLVDGLRVQLSDPGGAITQSGVRGFTVRNSFGWYLNCSDCQGRRATGTVGNLDFVPESSGR